MINQMFIIDFYKMRKINDQSEYIKILYVLQLDSQRNGRIIRFLYESGQINQNKEYSPLDLLTAELHNIDFSLSLIPSSLESISLNGIYLTNVTFHGSNLCKSNFSGSRLVDIIFSKSNLNNVDFTKAALTN
jgi:uncharacterized protein YjbI with pentapeptide repeats